MKKQLNFLIISILAISIIFLIADGSKGQQNHRFIKKIEESNKLAKDWIKNNFKDDGLFIYTYFPKSDSYSDSNNTIRQLMTSISIAKDANHSKDALEIHIKNLDFMKENWIKDGSQGSYVYFRGKSKLGANAMMLRTLIHSPFYEENKELAEKIYGGIIYTRNEDGSFVPWFVEPIYKYDEDRLLYFYSGEALLALVEYYEKTEDEGVLEIVKETADFYINEYVTNIEENYYPAYVPWQTLSLNKLYKIEPNEKYSEAIFVMNDKLLEILDRKDVIGRFYNPQKPEYGSPHVSSDGVYLDGLAYAYEIALLTNDKKRINSYKQAIEIAVDNLISLQYKKENEKFPTKNPKKYIGGFKKNIDNTDIRIDNTQHAIDAFEKILEIWDKN